MLFYIYVKGENIPNLPIDIEGDFSKFCYYSKVFDASSNFTQTCKNEIGGGTWHNGVTTLEYTSNNGDVITLDIDGGFPIPEAAYMTLESNDISERLFNDIVIAFENYHEIKFPYFKVIHGGSVGNKYDQYVNIYLFTQEP
ncbi:MAG: hypothetical protein IJ944_05580 [Clostridia bacterium]|nr:hypothetical protein [Clostridia bacterium]